MRAKIRKLARDGLSRNAVARECGVSTSTVSKVCAEARPPITFDRTAIAVATEARVTDLKARRASLAEALLDDVDKLRKALWTERERHHFSVTNGHQTYYSEPSPDELKNLFTAVGIAVDKHLVLIRADSDERDLPAVDQWLAAMMGKATA